MKTVVKGLFTTALLTALLMVFALPAQADQTATQNATVTVNCTATSGDYGQSTNNCSAVNSQNIQQNNRNIQLKHVPVDTGVDQTTTVAAIGAIVSTGAGALVTYKKMRG